MPFSCDERIKDKLSFVLEQIEFIKKTTAEISCGDDFAMSLNATILFNSTCMCLQTIGESLKAVDKMLGENNLSVRHPEVPWHQIFGLRNIISHEYASVDVDEIFNIVKNDLDALEEAVQMITKAIGL